jgi:nucleotide-binding universal stress UspA family protein
MAAGEERGHVHHLSRILFCTDFSENSEQALSYAISATAEYDAELTLLHALETQVDMVVMGVRGRGALDLAVFGSTTYRVLQLGPCPVLTVHI